MNQKLWHAIGQIGEDLITDADESRMGAQYKQKKTNHLQKYLGVAACLVIAVCAAVTIPLVGRNNDDASKPDQPPISAGESVQPSVSTNMPVSGPVYMDSLTELQNAIRPENEEDLLERYRQKGVRTEPLRAFLGKLRAKTVAPCQNGESVEFRNKKGFPNIALFASEAYGLPWLWYYPKVATGENFYIKITFLPDAVSGEEKTSASAVIGKLSPDSANIGRFGAPYKAVYEQNLQLKDREVTALVYEYTEDNRNTAFFVYDDMLVEMRSDPKVWNAEWFSALSFESVL